MTNWRLTALPVGPLQTNAYLLTAPAAGEAILIDPAYDADLLMQRVAAENCRLSQLLCTHGHFDHISAAAAVQRICDLPLLCHPLDAPLIQQMQRIQESYGFPATEVPRISATLADGMLLAFAQAAVAVRHVPGHSPGHVMFVTESDALVGDCVFAGSIGRTDLPGSSFVELERSIQTKIYTLPDGTRLHPGHGPATTVAQEKATNPFVRPAPDPS